MTVVVIVPTCPLHPPFTAWKPYPISPMRTFLLAARKASLPIPALERTICRTSITSLRITVLSMGTATCCNIRTIGTPIPPSSDSITDAIDTVSVTSLLSLPLTYLARALGYTVRRISLRSLCPAMVPRLWHRQLVQNGVTGVTS